MRPPRTKRIYDTRGRDLAFLRALTRDERIERARSLLVSEAKGHPFKESTEAFLMRWGFAPDEISEAATLSQGGGR